MDSIESLSKMKVADLKKHLKSKGLPVTGNKTELVERLQQALQSDENPILDSSGAIDDDEFDEEEILGGEDIDIDKITQEEEAAALAGNLRVKEDAILLSTTQTEKKKITLKRSEPSLSSASVPDTTQSVEDTVTSNTDPSTNLNEDKENSLEVEEPKHKVIKLSDDSTENALEVRAKKFGSDNPDSEEGRRLARASRFGVASTPSSQSSTNKKVPKLSMEVGSTDMDKLKKRAERFGEVTSKSLSKLEELEKKKSRLNRFESQESSEKKENVEKDVNSDSEKPAAGEGKENGTKVPITAPSKDDDDIKQKRAKRFSQQN